MIAPTIDQAPGYSAQNIATMTEVPLAWLVPSSFNPRRTFADDALDELAESLRQHGMLEPIVVRKSAWPESAQVRTRTDEIAPCLEVICGERRLRAATRAGLAFVPVRVLSNVDDRTALQLAIVENLQRVDLDPVEEAQGYAALRDHAGMKQTEIAAAVKRSQPAVAKSLGLLKLPEDVRQLIRDGTLTPSHGHLLEQWAAFPAYLALLVKEVVAGQWTTKRLAGEKLYVSWQMLHEAKILRDVSPGHALFDTAICQQCPFGAYRRQYEHGGGYCLKPEHYDQLQEAAKQAQRARLAADATAPPDEAAPVAPLPHLQDLSYDTYKTFGSASPAGCTKDCVCRGHAINHRGNVEAICTDPTRYAKLQAAEKRAENKAKRETVREQLTALATHLQSLEEIDSRELALLVDALFTTYLSHDKALAEAIDAQLPGLLDPTRSPERDELARMSPLGLVQFAVHRLLAVELYRTVENQWSTAPTYAWYERQMSLARKERACAG